MAEYRSATSVALSAGTAYQELGHVLGLAVVITRLIELYAAADKDTIKMVAELLRKNALLDIERSSKMSSLATADRAQVHEQARAMIDQVLKPLIELESVQ
jgi:hypothetical protein